MLETILAVLAIPSARLADIHDQFGLASLVCGFAFGALWYCLRRPRRPLRRLRAYLAASFPKRLLLHRSTLLDIKLFFLSTILMGTGLIFQFVSGGKMAGATEFQLEALLGASPFRMESSVAVAVGMTLLFLLFLDLAYWIAHWLMHRYTALWEFHKLHHSAEVLTPLTEWRQHPVELFLFPMSNAIVMGTFYGLAGYLFGPSARPYSWLEMNVLMAAFMFTTLHLRHSHFWLPTTGWLGHLIQSPAHHQIHHSEQEQHFGKNLGLFLSVWDWAFGTLHIPSKHEVLTFGIGEEGREHSGALMGYWLPVRNAWRHAAGRPAAPERAPGEALNRA